RACRIPVDPPHRRGLDPLPVDARRSAQPELLNEALKRAVARAVVDDDDLELRVPEPEERAHGLDDRLLFVVRRHQDGNRRSEVGLVDVPEVLEADRPQSPAHRSEGEKQQHEIDRVDRKEIGGDEEREENELLAQPGQNAAHGATSAVRAVMKSTWVAMSRTNGLASPSARCRASRPASLSRARASPARWRTQ